MLERDWRLFRLLPTKTSIYKPLPSSNIWGSIYNFLIKVCVFDLVQLEDDIGYIKSSHTDLSSTNWTRSKTQTLFTIILQKLTEWDRGALQHQTTVWVTSVRIFSRQGKACKVVDIFLKICHIYHFQLQIGRQVVFTGECSLHDSRDCWCFPWCRYWGGECHHQRVCKWNSKSYRQWMSPIVGGKSESWVKQISEIFEGHCSVAGWKIFRFISLWLKCFRIGRGAPT